MPRAGLTAASVTEAAADLVDEVGLDGLSMGLLAERLGVRAPSLYKHVTDKADLAHRIAVLAMHELADAVRDATQGLSGKDALVGRRAGHEGLRARSTPAGTPPATPPGRRASTTRWCPPWTGCWPRGRPCCTATGSSPPSRSTRCG